MVAVPALEGKIDLMREALPTRYLTRITVQGDNLGSTVGVFGDESVYIEGTPSFVCACYPLRTVGAEACSRGRIP